MTNFVKGVLVEYGTDLIGPLKNIVIFQFNPEEISRSINIPIPSTTPEGASAKETVKQTGTRPRDSFTLTVKFNAADKLNNNDIIARVFGIGPELAALEQMVFPLDSIGDLAGAFVDSIGDILGKSDKDTKKPIPRLPTPKILFIWGPSRILPVKIESMSITEQKFDFILNPIQATVELKLGILNIEEIQDEPAAKAAQQWTSLIKKTQAIANLKNTADAIVDVVLF
ncbi:MAG: hypothetical protein HRO68_10235 [Nitrosopumilus sp.]|nr:hypothetical protein [Nitrosopumilus sp.]